MKHIELNNMVTRKVDGFYDLAKDKEAILEFQKVVESKMAWFDSKEDRLEYLIAHNYYDNFLEQYAMEFILQLDTYVREHKFTFDSFMAIHKFYNDYAMKTGDKETYLEDYEDRIVAIALYLGMGDEGSAKRFASIMIKGLYQPATPTFLNAGKRQRGELISCYLLSIDDSMNSIGHYIDKALYLSKIGGGVALELSRLRSLGESIKEQKNAASGVLPVMKLLEDAFSYANQLGQRKGAGAVYLNVFHDDVIDFLDCKKINADEKTRIKTLSLGLTIPKIFFELAKNNQPYATFKPRNVFEVTGQHLDEIDFDKDYWSLYNNPNIIKTERVSARDLLTRVATTQLESGYPYVYYPTNANEKHALKKVGQIKMTNLCTEIYQLQETSIINDYDEADEIKRDVSCTLGSLNIVNVMEKGLLPFAVMAATESLTNVTKLTSIKNAPSIKKANDEMHSIGLGALNLHGYLAKNGIAYESEEAKDFVRTFFMTVNFYSLKASNRIAHLEGVTFKDFDKSDYADGSYFEKYINNDYFPKSNKVKDLFAPMEESIPTKEDWEILSKQIQNHGLYHAYRLAIAPNGSTSYIQNATSSVMPITQDVEERTYGTAVTFYPMPYMTRENYMYYMKKAYDMDMMKVIDLVAEIQEHIDQGISTILFVNADVSTNELVKYYAYASHKGLKALYYTRVRKLKMDGTPDCEACFV